jgi:hypothetical protein
MFYNKSFFITVERGTMITGKLIDIQNLLSFTEEQCILRSKKSSHGTSRSASVDRSGMAMSVPPPGAMPSQPFIQDPSMPVKAQTHDLTITPSVCFFVYQNLHVRLWML